MDRIQPIDEMIRAGLTTKLIEQFRAPTTWTSVPDKLQQLKVMLGNRSPEYPYLFVTQQSVAPNPDGYNSRKLARDGVPVAMSDDGRQLFYARLIPQNYELELTYVTNKFNGDLDSVEGFARRWQFARRNGYLQYRIKYGLTTMDIAVVLTDSVSTPVRENPADQEAVYQVVASMTIKGYTSLADLGSRQRVLEIEAQTTVAGVAVSPTDTQFFPFPQT